MDDDEKQKIFQKGFDIGNTFPRIPSKDDIASILNWSVHPVVLDMKKAGVSNELCDRTRDGIIKDAYNRIKSAYLSLPKPRLEE